MTSKSLSSLTQVSTTDTGDYLYVVRNGNSRRIHAGHLIDPDENGEGIQPGIVNLHTFLDQVYGVGSWAYRTTEGTGSDIGPAVEAACDYIRSNYSRGTVYVPPGNYRLATSLNAAKLSGIVIDGGVQLAATITFDNASGVAFQFSGASGYTGGGLRNLAILLESDAGTSGSEAIRLDGDSSDQPDQFIIENIYISTQSGSSYWYNGIVVTGLERTSPQGVRRNVIRNVEIFYCSNAALQLYNAVHWTIDKVGSYNGTGGGNDMYISGGGASNTNSIQIWLNGIICGGILTLVNCSSIFGFIKAATVVVDSTYTRSIVFCDADSISGTPGTDGSVVNVNQVIYNSTTKPHTAGSIELGHASDTTLSRLGAGTLGVEGVQVALNSTGQTHTASSLELGHANDTTLSRLGAGNLGVEGVQVALNSTSQTHVASTVELGHATDTTLARDSAGNISVEGNLVYRAGGTDVPVADGGSGASTARGACANFGTWNVIKASGVSVSHTGNTNETALATISIPAGAMGANGVLSVNYVMTITNNGNGKTGRVRLNGLAGTSFYAVALASQASHQGLVVIQNRNAQNSQVCAASMTTSLGNTTAANVTGSIDTSGAVDLVISGQLTNGADTITLERYIVQLCYVA